MRQRIHRSRYVPVAVVALLLVSLPAQARHGSDYDASVDDGVFYDRAQVLRVEPIYELVRTPVERQDCWVEEHHRTERGGRGGASMVVGGIIGGVIGHQVGDGDRQKVATVAGTILGAAVGREMDRAAPARPRVVEERRCRVSEDVVEEEYLRGYDVTYRYQGRRFTTFTDAHPGKFLHVRVGITPVLD